MVGRVKLKISKLENTNSRQVTYAKRKGGIIKKAKELSVLCDIDVVLLMFSPYWKAYLVPRRAQQHWRYYCEVCSINSTGKSEKALKKTFKKLDHDVNVQDFLHTSTQTIEELTSQSRLLQAQLLETHKGLSDWTNPDKINNIEHLKQMEDSLEGSLNQIQTHKENCRKQQLMSLECPNQFQNGMHLPLSWLPISGNQHMILPEDPNLLPHRDMECSTDVFLPSYSGYFDTSKQGIDDSGQEGFPTNELSRTACFSLQLGGQYPYLPYNLNLLSEKKFKPELEMNVQENPADYQVNSSFKLSRPGCDTSHYSWDSTSRHYAVAIFDEHSYPQVE